MSTRTSTRVRRASPPQLWWWAGVLLVALAAAALVAARITDLPRPAVAGAGGAITVLYAAALAHRLGGRTLVCAGVTLVLVAAAQITDRPLLQAGVAAAATVVTGVLAVTLTEPAASGSAVAQEVLLAISVSAVGALAVATYDVGLDVERLRYLTLAVAVLAMLLVVGSLGVGHHGLGRSGTIGLVLGGVVLVGALVYGQALGRWGSAGLVEAVEQVRRTTVDLLGAVPHPIEALVGLPALAFGVHLRARRRQGWWVCVFGVVATVSTASALVDPGLPMTRVLLSAVYSWVVGLALGFAAIRVDTLLHGGRRSTRSAGGGGGRGTRRIEPPRGQPLR